jgi:hypothetical protein
MYTVPGFGSVSNWELLFGSKEKGIWRRDLLET